MPIIQNDFGASTNYLFRYNNILLRIAVPTALGATTCVVIAVSLHMRGSVVGNQEVYAFS
ncbi:hypothetical protein S101446_00761 [Komagataeibacter europaeus]|nr:hypothetical protein S101446_00761 [Komagataeibacter europaeus]